MDETHEVPSWWDPEDEWHLAAVTWEMQKGRLVPLPERDRVNAWRYVEDSDELRVRVPREIAQNPDEGLWIEKRYRLTDDGRIVPTGAGQMMDFGGRDPLTSEVLAAVGIRGVDVQIGRELRVVARRWGLGEAWERASAEVKRPGRRGMSTAELAQWAERFAEALSEDKRRPYRVLMDRYPGWSDSGLKSIVRRARKAGLLTEVGQGETGGALTDKAKELLETTEGD